MYGKRGNRYKMVTTLIFGGINFIILYICSQAVLSIVFVACVKVITVIYFVSIISIMFNKKCINDIRYSIVF